MTLTSYDAWTVSIAAACAVACAVPGCFLVLRRASLLGDAISHAVLPGIALAFIVTSSRDALPMMLGAGVFALLTALLTSDLHRLGRVDADASLAIVFTALFAVGVLLLSLFAHDVDLDPGCVLYGVLESAAYDTTDVGPRSIPRALVSLVPLAAVNLVLSLVFLKELRVVCFDPGFARSIGISVAGVHAALMLDVAATSVAAFESVGSVLVVAMLIAPAATARLLTDRLGLTVAIAVAMALVSSLAGYALALWLDATIAGMMGSVSLALFLGAVALAPREGLLSKFVRRRALRARIAREDVLGLLFRARERGEAATRASLARGLRRDPARVLRSLGRASLTRLSSAGQITLTERGLSEANRVIASHRLWESYLARNLSLPLDHLHDPSHRMEHYISPELSARLRAEVDRSDDPHGRAIPP